MDVEPPAVDVVANAGRLNELDRLIVKAVVEWDTDALARMLTEFRELKTATRLALLNAPVNPLPNITDVSVRGLLQRISSGQPLPVEQALSGTGVGALMDSALSEQEIEALGSELLYSWISHYEFVEALYEIGSVVLAVGNVPATLARVVDEARHCYAFQQYGAVCSLSRTMLEIALRDLAVKTGALPADSENVKEVRSRLPDLYDLIEKFCDRCANGAHLRDRLHTIRREGNASAHGRLATDKAAARALLRDTLAVLHEAYEYAYKNAHENAA
jgi:hypothetical protein